MHYELWTIKKVIQWNSTSFASCSSNCNSTFIFFLFFDPALEPSLRALACTLYLVFLVLILAFDGWPKGFAGWPKGFASWPEAFAVEHLHLHIYWNWNPYLQKYYQLSTCLVSLTSRKITYEVMTIMLNDNENNIHNINIKYKWNKIDGVNTYLRTSNSCSNCPCNRGLNGQDLTLWFKPLQTEQLTKNLLLHFLSSVATLFLYFFSLLIFYCLLWGSINDLSLRFHIRSLGIGVNMTE